MRVHAPLWSLLILLAPALTTAQAPSNSRDAEARALFEAGNVAYEDGRLDAALEYFQRAFELSGRIELLLNIARTAEQVRQDQVAIDAYEQFLREAPEDSPHRTRAENRLAALRQLVQRGSGDGGGGGGDGDGGGGGGDAPAAAGSDVAPWIVLGVSGAVAVTGVILVGLAAADVAAVDGAPEGSDFALVRDAYERSEPLSIAGFVLLGAGVAGVAASIAWALTGSSSGGGGESASLRLSFGPSSVALSGRF